MNDKLLMCIFDRLAYPAKQSQPVGNRQPLTVAITVERHAVNVLHDEIRPSVIGSAAVDQPGNERVVKCGEDLAFVAKAAQHKVGIDAAFHDL